MMMQIMRKDDSPYSKKKKLPIFVHTNTRHMNWKNEKININDNAKES